MAQSRVSEWRVVREQLRMRDGTKLATTVFLPLADISYPIVLERTAYSRMLDTDSDRAGNSYLYAPFSPNDGIGLVVQDCRGRYGSEGLYEPFRFEAEDGYDTLEWILGPKPQYRP